MVKLVVGEGAIACPKNGEDNGTGEKEGDALLEREFRAGLITGLLYNFS